MKVNLSILFFLVGAAIVVGVSAAAVGQPEEGPVVAESWGSRFSRWTRPITQPIKNLFGRRSDSSSTPNEPRVQPDNNTEGWGSKIRGWGQSIKRKLFGGSAQPEPEPQFYEHKPKTSAVEDRPDPEDLEFVDDDGSPIEPMLKGGPTFKMMIFALQWPQALFVNDKTIPKSNWGRWFHEKWTIHGLWPQTSSVCTGPEFDKKTFEDIKSKLALESWPSLIMRETQDFWKHEWDKHGKCSNMAQNTYFETAHNLWVADNIADWLKKAKVVPTKVSSYDRSTVEAALEKYLGKDKFRLQCGSVDKKKMNVLMEVHICMDSEAKQTISCGKKTSNCDQRVIYFPKEKP